MKSLQSLLSATAAAHNTTESDVTESLRALTEHLMEDPEFRCVWEEIPKNDDCADWELLLALLIAGKAGASDICPHTDAAG